jgi:3-deoxy-D-manno-octulosonic-acid transferase
VRKPTANTANEGITLCDKGCGKPFAHPFPQYKPGSLHLFENHSQLRYLFYRLFLKLYLLGAVFLSLANLKARKWLKGRHNWRKWWSAHLFEKGIEQHDDIVWMHASSLGEFEQGAPLLEAIRRTLPQVKIIVTFYSPSGYEVRKDYQGANLVGYLPFDHPRQSASFVRMINPSLVLWVKYEYWYYTLEAIQRQKIPLLLVSGIFRNNQPFFKWYGALYREMLGFFTHLFVQTETSRVLAASIIGEDNITVTGDTRFDRVAAIAANWQPVEGIAQWIDDATEVIVAGSTWPADEEELVHYFKTRKHLKLILVPHSVDESMLEATMVLYPQALKYSQLLQAPVEGKPMQSQILVIDNVGLLARLYRYGKIAYVGGGFTGDGVHNVLEAAVYGIPVVHGPEYEKYAEAMGLAEAGGSSVIENALQLEDVFNQLLHQPEIWAKASSASLDFVQSCTGATQKIMHYIQEKRLEIMRQKR